MILFYFESQRYNKNDMRYNKKRYNKKQQYKFFMNN